MSWKFQKLFSALVHRSGVSIVCPNTAFILKIRSSYGGTILEHVPNSRL
ncbi:unnamed protein product [Larinioides sclopetarius]|uniref:Uncharacterized protein n=1 Tax=Larinioides sclopetarius TaxID=280406 RepID=A0AAV1ZQV1_9ARAC